MVKTTRITSYLVGLIAGIALFSSCDKDAINGSVSGTISIYDPESPTIKTPIEGIRVLVVDTDFVVDSLDYSHNEAAIIGEAITDSEGKYMIGVVYAGNYAVIPIPDSLMYRFEPENEENGVNFSISEEFFDYSFDFSAPELKKNDDVFHVHISIINRPAGGSISMSRPVFLFNIFPTYNPVSLNGSYTSDGDEISLDLHYGIFYSLYVTANHCRIKAYDPSGLYLFTRWLDNDFFNTPKSAHWQIDWSAMTVKRID